MRGRVMQEAVLDMAARGMATYDIAKAVGATSQEVAHIVAENQPKLLRVRASVERQTRRADQRLDDDDVMNVAAVARLLKCSEWMVRDLAKRGELPHVRVGRLIRFNRRVIERMFSA